MRTNASQFAALREAESSEHGADEGIRGEAIEGVLFEGFGEKSAGESVHGELEGGEGFIGGVLKP